MANIFITGIAGFLGSHLADRMIALGHTVAGCDSMIGGYADNVPSKANFILEDCNNLEAIKMAMKDTEILYHCAATAYTGLSVFCPHTVTTNIIGASVGAFTAAACNRVKRIVHCSSMSRYGKQEVVPFTEDMLPAPVDPYGIGKVSTEHLLKNICDANGIEWVIAIPHNIIGPRQKYDDPYRNVASIMVNLMMQGRQPFIYGDGKQKRCFSFVEDDIGILEKLALDPLASGELFNIGPDEEFVTIIELAEIIADILNFKLDPIFTPGPPAEVAMANCSAKKIRDTFGYSTKYSLRQGLQSIADYIETRGTRKFSYHLPLEIVTEKTPKTWTGRLM